MDERATFVLLALQYSIARYLPTDNAAILRSRICQFSDLNFSGAFLLLLLSDELH
jgi:hypothetical protein